MAGIFASCYRRWRDGFERERVLLAACLVLICTGDTPLDGAKEKRTEVVDTPDWIGVVYQHVIFVESIKCCIFDQPDPRDVECVLPGDVRMMSVSLLS